VSLVRPERSQSSRSLLLHVGPLNQLGRNRSSHLPLPRHEGFHSLHLVDSVHFKSNPGELQTDIAKREEAARQLIAHTAEMERLYSTDAKVVTVIAGDFNTDPTDPRFAEEKTFGMLRQKFEWAWENVPLSERVTLPAKGRYPDASFDGFLVRGAQVLSCKAIPIQEVSDHFPAILTIAIH
jgi:endonuclease/exonuclease/phosphatase family metal-dependent hydrolase